MDFLLEIPKGLTFCEDLILRIWPKFAKFAKINPLKVVERYVNGKMIVEVSVAEDTVDKNCELIHL